MGETIQNSNDFALELARLHILKGMDFSHQLQTITMRKEFQLVRGETSIYSAITESAPDFDALINAARRAVEHGYCVFILTMFCQHGNQLQCPIVSYPDTALLPDKPCGTRDIDFQRWSGDVSEAQLCPNQDVRLVFYT